MGRVPVPSVLLQHSHEAPFLWLLRSRATTSPHYGFSDLAKLDGRLEAHLDGLRIAGDEGWKPCAEQLAVNEVGEVFAAAVLAFESGDKGRVAQVLEAGTAESELTDGLVSALGWLPFDKAASHVGFLLSSDTAVLRRVGLAGCAVHRQHLGDALRKFLRDEDLRVRARALRAVGELGRVELVQETWGAGAAEDAEVRFWSAWSTALLSGMAGALERLQALAEKPGQHQQAALELLIRRLQFKDAQTLVRQLVQHPDHVRTAIFAAGVLGDPESIPWLIERMNLLPLARRAGEAFTMITGADLAYRDLERKPPADFEAGPTDDPNDENVAMDPDDNLPWPEPGLVQKWWDKNRGQFQNGTRYLLGKPMTPDWLKTVLRDGRQRQRAAAALELAIRNPGQPLFNVKAPGFRQIQALGKPGPTLR